MSKIKILHQFNLPDERAELNTLIKAQEFKSVLWDLDQEMRKIVKYGVDESQVIKDFTIGCTECGMLIDGIEEKPEFTESEKQKFISGYISGVANIRKTMWDLIKDENITIDD